MSGRSRRYANAAAPEMFKDGGVAAGDGGKRLSGAPSVDAASADFRPLRRADVAAAPPP